MNRQLKWIGFGILALVAAIGGRVLAEFVFENSSGGKAALFTLAMLAVVVGIFVWLLSGNRKVTLADGAATSAALAMKPAEGKAAIYIMRKGFVGMLQGFDFEIEGVARGQAKGNQLLYAEVAPGTYRITAKARGNGGETQVSVSAGEVAVLHVFLEPGLMKGMIMFDRIAEPARARTDLASVRMVCWES